MKAQSMNPVRNDVSITMQLVAPIIPSTEIRNHVKTKRPYRKRKNRGTIDVNLLASEFMEWHISYMGDEWSGDLNDHSIFQVIEEWKNDIEDDMVKWGLNYQELRLYMRNMYIKEQ